MSSVSRSAAPLIFGEVLFDCFPDGSKVLGGAPFNVAWHLAGFGESPLFVSRVGEDDEGRAILEAMRAHGMRTDGVQLDPSLPTGRVAVHFEDDEPHYDIVHPSAWDAIADMGMQGHAGMIYHGSLALRDAPSREALAAIRQRMRAPVFLDVNLRAPWWRTGEVVGMLGTADWVKLNGDELELLAPGFEAQRLIEAHGLMGLILTRGSQGAEILTPGTSPLRVQPGRAETVVDTVGAGDAFASVMLLGILRGWPLALTAGRAQAFASRIVGCRGATVDDPAFYREIVDAWDNAEPGSMDDV